MSRCSIGWLVLIIIFIFFVNVLNDIHWLITHLLIKFIQVILTTQYNHKSSRLKYSVILLYSLPPPNTSSIKFPNLLKSYSTVYIYRLGFITTKHGYPWIFLNLFNYLSYYTKHYSYLAR